MKFTQKIILFSISCIIMITLMFGCFSVDVFDDSVTFYIRNDVYKTCSAEFFGKGSNDDIYVALFLYSNEDIINKYGDEFNILPEDVICYTSEGETFLFSNLYKGTADYGFNFDEEIYRIKLSKSYFGNWKVIDSYFE